MDSLSDIALGDSDPLSNNTRRKDSTWLQDLLDWAKAQRESMLAFREKEEKRIEAAKSKHEAELKIAARERERNPPEGSQEWVRKRVNDILTRGDGLIELYANMVRRQAEEAAQAREICDQVEEKQASDREHAAAVLQAGVAVSSAGEVGKVKTRCESEGVEKARSDDEGIVGKHAGAIFEEDEGSGMKRTMTVLEDLEKGVKKLTKNLPEEGGLESKDNEKSE